MNCNWDFIDKDNAWCINLYERNDRFENVQNEFTRVGLIDKVSFYRTVKDKEGARRGCWISHIECFKRIRESQKPYGLIFEDDLIFDDKWKNYLQIIKKFLSMNHDAWDIFYIGAMPYGYISCDTDICKIKGAHLAHAYFINRRFIDKILNDSTFNPDNSKNLHIDEWFCKNDNNYFVLKNLIVYQNNSQSDNKWYDLKWMQNIVQRNWIKTQKLANRFAWLLRHFPIKIQLYINPIFIYFSICEMINNFYT